MEAKRIEEKNTTPDYIIGLKNCKVCYSNFVKNERIDMCEECVSAFECDRVIICGNWGGGMEFVCGQRMCAIFKTCTCEESKLIITGKFEPNTVCKNDCLGICFCK
jgi:hypothetical protein